tara:strand:- start:8 stop:688 length:681 start_codon:yes stop_codon:yes gene_type:complete
MMLVEEGKVAPNDPLSKFVPEFASVEVLNDAGERVPSDGPTTIQHLLTHTSGLTYGFFGNTPVDQLYREAGTFANATSLEQFASEIAALPLLAHPGEVWNYSVSTDILGRMVKVASEQSFDAFLREHIFGPLGMEDTAFHVAAEKLHRFSGNYATVDGELRLTDSPVDGQYTRPAQWLSGGEGSPPPRPTTSASPRCCSTEASSTAPGSSRRPASTPCERITSINR